MQLKMSVSRVAHNSPFKEAAPGLAGGLTAPADQCAARQGQVRAASLEVSSVRMMFFQKWQPMFSDSPLQPNVFNRNQVPFRFCELEHTLRRAGIRFFVGFVWENIGVPKSVRMPSKVLFCLIPRKGVGLKRQAGIVFFSTCGDQLSQNETHPEIWRRYLEEHWLLRHSNIAGSIHMAD